jgi:hypothetical protein
MKNIFVELKAKVLFKRDPLLKMLNIDPEEDNLPDYLEDYLEVEGERSDKDNLEFIFTLIKHQTDSSIKEKLYALLVYYVAKQNEKEANATVDRVENSAESITTKVRLYSPPYSASPCSTRALNPTNSKSDSCYPPCLSSRRRTKYPSSAISSKTSISWLSL